MDESKNIEPSFSLPVVREAYLDCFSIDGWDTFLHVLTLRQRQLDSRRAEADRRLLERQQEEEQKREVNGDD